MLKTYKKSPHKKQAPYKKAPHKNQAPHKKQTTYKKKAPYKKNTMQSHLDTVIKTYFYKPQKYSIESVIKSLASLETRALHEKNQVRSIQSLPIFTSSENSFSFICDIPKDKPVATKILMKNCNKSIKDYGSLLEGSFEPPSFIKINSTPSGDDILHLLQTPTTTNCYDVPIAFVKNGKCNISIPNQFKLFEEVIQKTLNFMLNYNKNTEGLIIMASLQVSVSKPNQSSSLIGTHLDNVMSPYYEERNINIKTTQTPTALYTLEYVKNDKGHWVLSHDNDMSTVLYAVQVTDKSIQKHMMDEAKKINTAHQWVPFEILAILVKYAKMFNEKIKIEKYKANNGVVSLFNHVHKALYNKSNKTIMRVQMRMMACNISVNDNKIPQTRFYGYDKQGTNYGLDELLAKNYKHVALNSWEKTGCNRYQHFNYALGRCELFENPQVYEQKYNLKNAIDKGFIETNYPDVFKLVYDHYPTEH